MSAFPPTASNLGRGGAAVANDGAWFRVQGCASVLSSIENRYFTSLLSILAYASSICWIGIISMSATIPLAAQKSSISWVSAMPPIIQPAMLRRLETRLKMLGEG